MDRVAKLTLTLSGFMLFLLIIIPFTIDSDTSSYIAPYLIYSLFLTSVGIIIGISITWLNYPRRIEIKEKNYSTPTTKKKLLSVDEKIVSDLLISNSGEMWQADLVKKSGFSDSKASRLLSRMENRGTIKRIRDGMGKRVLINQEITE
tara:strand:- start:187 stop:630 length:444 start_codon:yes stop_codon:yes gene_type:complete